MRPWLLVVVTAWGCTGKLDSDTDVASDTDTDADSDADSDSDSDADTDVEPIDDESVVRSLIAGDGNVEQVLLDIAWSGGWPVHTADDTYLFVLETSQNDWAIAGDHDAWAGSPMTAGTGFVWAEVAISEPVGSHYKFVHAGTDYYGDPTAKAHSYDEFGDVSYVRAPTDVWHLDRWPNFSGEGVLSREVNVYVPAGEGPWPVLYMHDGQNLFAWDPEGLPSAGWRIDAALAENGAQTLVVGIDNTSERLDEYAHTDENVDGLEINAKGDAYAAFVTEDVKPFVERTYDVTDRAGVMGSSMGGLISLYIGLLYPDEYDFVGSMSGSLWLGRYTASGPAMQELYLEADVEPFTIYVDSGGSDGGDGCEDIDGDGIFEDDPNATDGYCVTRAFADEMAEHGYVWDDTLFHWHEPNAQHTESDWAARVFRPLAHFTDGD